MPVTSAGFGSGWDQFTGLGEIEFALKNFYLPGMEEQKNNARVLLANLERNEKDVSGSKAYVPVLLGRNWGLGMRRNRQKLPDPGAQRGDRAEVEMRYAFGRLLVTLHAMTATKNAQGSYDNVLDVETDGLMEDLPKDINRQLFLDGTGRIGRLSADATESGGVTTFTLDNNGLVAPLVSSEFTKYFENGMVLDGVESSGNTVVQTDITVLGVTANTVTATGDFTTVDDNDYLTIKGNYANEVSGLLAVVSDTGTFQGIDRAAAGNERWKAHVTSTSGDITEALFQTLWTNIQKASGMSPTMILGTYELRDKYASILATAKRFVNTIEYKGGYKGPEFNGVGVVPDTEAPKGHAFMLNLPYMALYQQAGLQFMDDDGSILARVSDYAAYEATLYWFFQLGARRCNVHGRISGINQ